MNPDTMVALVLPDTDDELVQALMRAANLFGWLGGWGVGPWVAAERSAHVLAQMVDAGQEEATLLPLDNDAVAQDPLVLVRAPSGELAAMGGGVEELAVALRSGDGGLWYDRIVQWCLGNVTDRTNTFETIMEDVTRVSWLLTAAMTDADARRLVEAWPVPAEPTGEWPLSCDLTVAVRRWHRRARADWYRVLFEHPLATITVADVLGGPD